MEQEEIRIKLLNLWTFRTRHCERKRSNLIQNSKSSSYNNSKSSLEGKWGYRYLLTPEGIKEKVRITREFVKRKMAEYEKLLEQD